MPASAPERQPRGSLLLGFAATQFAVIATLSTTSSRSLFIELALALAATSLPMLLACWSTLQDPAPKTGTKGPLAIVVFLSAMAGFLAILLMILNVSRVAAALFATSSLCAATFGASYDRRFKAKAVIAPATTSGSPNAAGLDVPDAPKP